MGLRFKNKIGLIIFSFYLSNISWVLMSLNKVSWINSKSLSNCILSSYRRPNNLKGVSGVSVVSGVRLILVLTNSRIFIGFLTIALAPSLPWDLSLLNMRLCYRTNLVDLTDFSIKFRDIPQMKMQVVQFLLQYIHPYFVFLVIFPTL